MSEAADGRIEIVFDAFALIADQLRVKYDEVSAEAVEWLFRQQLTVSHTNWVHAGAIEFDSEGSAVILIATNSIVAGSARHTLDQLLTSKQTLRRLWRSHPRSNK